ncbi:MAG: polyphosphate kinase 1, partial [Chitinophagia bacterium]|nr:polyphosphate kinase 1 [Chitinophagia bacterium]
MINSTRQTIVRDLSWLSFNARVLQEAHDETNHIYDRIRFLGIFSNNLDEFFRVRVATLNKMVKLGAAANVHLEANPEKILKKIQQTVIAQQQEFDQIFSNVIRELEKIQVYLKNDTQLSPDQKDYVKRYFDLKVRTQIIPLMIEDMHHAPPLKDKAIYLACKLGSISSPAVKRYALIEIPTKVLPRFITLPTNDGATDIILLEDIIRFNLQYLFAPFGFDKFSGHIIKVTRDAELTIDNDIATDVISELEK